MELAVYQDDHKDISGVNRVFWERSETRTYTVGLSVGTALGEKVSTALI